MEGIYEVRPEMAQVPLYTYVQSFIKVGSGLQKLIRGIHRKRYLQTHREYGDRITLLSFFLNKEIELKL
jgi:hypothetical protein